ncbi:MAG: ATP-binding protein, partial [Bacteroidales bacterium]
LANMSHEIRTPMNGILGFADLLKRQHLPEEKQKDYIDIIEKSGNRMLDLINDLINISKIESGQLDLSFTEININAQLNFLYEFFQLDLENKGLEMNIHCPVPIDKAKLVTDREKFDAIVSNLIKNALKFTKEGRIDIGYEPQEDQIKFFVKDTGTGIPKDKQEAVFGRFVQADSHMSREYEGAGLGLSITKAYVEALDGKIWIESEKDKGTIIYFTLPLKHKAEKAENIKTVDSTGNFANSTVLAAEDDEFNYLLLEELLLEKNMNIIRAKNGQEAIDICTNNPTINLILMDIKMPVMDGYEAAKRIRKLKPELPIIAQSAYAMEHEIKKFSTIFDDYITKPIKEDELMLKMKKWLTKE